MRWGRLIIDNSQHSGFSSVEALLAALLFGFMVTALSGAIVYGQRTSVDAGAHARATLLASEGLEAVRSIRDTSYAGLCDGTYGLAKSGGVWTLSGGNDAVDIYTRQLTIASAGTNRKAITASVRWSSGFANSEVVLTSRLTNWRSTFVPPESEKSWLNAIYTGGVDIAGNSDGLKVATLGSYAYIIRSNGSPNFIVLNIANPAAPQVVGGADLPGIPTNIAVSGNYAYVTNSSNTAELQTVAIANPAAPALASTVNLPGNANADGVFVKDSHVFVVRSIYNSGDELVIASIATPSSPVVVGGYNNDVAMREVHVAGDYAYIATESNSQELLIVNVAVPSLPVYAGSLNLSGNTNATTITVSGGRVFLAQDELLHAVDVGVPAAPVLLGTYTATAAVNDIASNINDPAYIFMGTNDAGSEMQMLHVGNPAAMSLARAVDIPSENASLNGVAYNAAFNILVGASSPNTLEGVVFAPN